MLDSLFEVYDNLVFFDTETTGLDAVNDRIIELACHQIKKDGTTNSFDWFIEPDDHRHIPENITEITHISDYDVYYGDHHISEDVAITLFTDYIDCRKHGKTLLIAHNAQFDLNFVAELLVRHGAADIYPIFKAADYLDTLTVFKDRTAYPHKLCNAIDHYNLSSIVANTHRAIDDTEALAYVTEAMGNERDDLIEYVNLFGFNPKYGTSGKHFKKVTYCAQPYYDYMKPADAILPRVAVRAKVEQIKLDGLN